MIFLRWSGIALFFLYIGGLSLLFLVGDGLIHAHLTGYINFFSSDGSIFYHHYLSLSDENLLSNYWIFLRGAPVLLMRALDGNLLFVLLLQLTLIILTLKISVGYFNTGSGRILFIFLSLFFPYLSFGFLSLNKEIFVMCSAIFFASYLSRGLKFHLAMALILAAAGRVYMLAALIILLFMIPRNSEIKYWRILFTLFVFTTLAPFSSSLVPGFQSLNLLENNTGRMAPLLATAVNNFGYFLIYPIKYVLIIPSRAYGYFIVGGSNDFTGALVSIVSLTMLLIATWLWLKRGKLSTTVKSLILAGYVAPVPILWIELVHWRYYSFVYFFFLFALIIHLEERRALRRMLQSHKPKDD